MIVMIIQGDVCNIFFYLVCYFYLTIHQCVWHVYLSLEMDPVCVCVCVFSFWLIFFWWFFSLFSKIVTKLIWKVSGDSIHLVFQNKTFGKKFCKKLACYAKWLSCRLNDAHDHIIVCVWNVFGVNFIIIFFLIEWLCGYIIFINWHLWLTGKKGDDHH